MKYTQDKLFDFIKHDMLLSIYNNPLLKEKSQEVASTYSYLYNFDIRDNEYVAPLLVVNPQVTESMFSKVAYDVVQSLGLNHFTNADLKNKPQGEVLIHSIKLDHESASDKINQLFKLGDTPVLLNLYALEGASPVTVNTLKHLLAHKPDNIFLGVDSKAPVHGLTELQTVEVENAPKPKMK